MARNWRRGQDIEGPPSREWIGAYDGERSRIWILPLGDAGTGHIFREVIPDATPTPTRFALTVNGDSWFKDIDNGTVELIGTESINGHLCYIITGKTRVDKDGKAFLAYKAWIDINRGFLPLRMMCMRTNGEIHYTLDSIQLQQFSENIWFPIEGTQIVNTGYTEHSVFTNVKINEEINDDLFLMSWTDWTNIPEETIQGQVGRQKSR